MAVREDKRQWSFPQYCGAVGFREDVMVSVLPAHLAACRRDVGAWKVVVDGDRITFTGSAIGTAFGPGRNTLAPFGCGELELDSTVREVRYRLRLQPLIALAAVAVGFAGAFLFCGKIPTVGIAFALPVVGIILVGGNLLFGVLIFSGFLHRSIAKAPKNPVDEQTWRAVVM